MPSALEKEFIVNETILNGSTCEADEAVQKFFIARFFNFEWHLLVQRFFRTDTALKAISSLEVTVACQNVTQALVPIHWGIKTKCSVRIKQKYARIVKCFNEDNTSDVLMEKFSVPIDELDDGSVPVRIWLSVDDVRKKFDDPEFSDVTLIVDRFRFFVSRWFLASQSATFKRMLSGPFKEAAQKEIKIDEKDPYAFHRFLEVLQGDNVVNDDTVISILILADYFMAPTAHTVCQAFLMKGSNKTTIDLLKIATRFQGMRDLKEVCFTRLEDNNEFEKFVGSFNYSFDLSKEDSHRISQLCYHHRGIAPAGQTMGSHGYGTRPQPVQPLYQNFVRGGHLRSVFPREAARSPSPAGSHRSASPDLSASSRNLSPEANRGGAGRGGLGPQRGGIQQRPNPQGFQGRGGGRGIADRPFNRQPSPGGERRDWFQRNYRGGRGGHQEGGRRGPDQPSNRPASPRGFGRQPSPDRRSPTPPVRNMNRGNHEYQGFGGIRGGRGRHESPRGGFRTERGDGSSPMEYREVNRRRSPSLSSRPASNRGPGPSNRSPSPRGYQPERRPSPDRRSPTPSPARRSPSPRQYNRGGGYPVNHWGPGSSNRAGRRPSPDRRSPTPPPAGRFQSPRHNGGDRYQGRRGPSPVDNRGPGLSNGSGRSASTRRSPSSLLGRRSPSPRRYNNGGGGYQRQRQLSPANRRPSPRGYQPLRRPSPNRRSPTPPPRRPSPSPRQYNRGGGYQGWRGRSPVNMGRGPSNRPLSRGESQPVRRSSPNRITPIPLPLRRSPAPRPCNRGDEYQGGRRPSPLDNRRPGPSNRPLSRGESRPVRRSSPNRITPIPLPLRRSPSLRRYNGGGGSQGQRHPYPVNRQPGPPNRPLSPGGSQPGRRPSPNRRSPTPPTRNRGSNERDGTREGYRPRPYEMPDLNFDSFGNPAGINASQGSQGEGGGLSNRLPSPARIQRAMRPVHQPLPNGNNRAAAQLNDDDSDEDDFSDDSEYEDYNLNRDRNVPERNVSSPIAWAPETIPLRGGVRGGEGSSQG